MIKITIIKSNEEIIERERIHRIVIDELSGLTVWCSNEDRPEYISLRSSEYKDIYLTKE